MPRKLIFYSFLTFVLLPISAILGITCLFAIPTAFRNPTALLDIFILASFVIYTFSAFSFFVRGIQTGKPFKASFRDFIKVNGYVAFISSALTVLAALLFYLVPAFQNYTVTWLMQMQTASSSGGLDKQHATLIIGKMLAGSAGYSALVITHFIITLQLLKMYGSLFVKKEG